jgi:hypothetical protein
MLVETCGRSVIGRFDSRLWRGGSLLSRAGVLADQVPLTTLTQLLP